MPKAKLVAQFFQNLKSFDSVVSKVKFLTADAGDCTAELKIEVEHTNPLGGLHGGFSATLVDVITSAALLTHDKGERPSVSVNMNLVYVKDARIGDEIVINSKSLRVGKKIAFLEAEIRKKDTNDLLVRGEHTKYFLGAGI